MEIYQAIRKASPKSSEGVLQRMAVATSLVHAVPMKLSHSGAHSDGAVYIDPVKRYLSYEKAHLNGELDPAFKDLTTWELTMVVDTTDADKTLDWGREMMRSYHPTLMTLNYEDQRYAKIVDAEIQYTSEFVKHDRRELPRMQNILANGGICGRRAFFGRFVLRAFGVPSTARPEPGHATLAHWSPSGWQAYLGSQWGSRARIIGYGRDLNFLASARARENTQEYMQVRRAQWIGAVAGERLVVGIHGGGKPKFWHAAAIIKQDAIADKVAAKVTKPTAKEIKYAFSNTTVSADEQKITINSDNIITIPAVATKIPENNTILPAWGTIEAVSFAKSNLGGSQLYYSRYGGAQALEYSFDVAKAGKYELTSRVITTYWDMGFLTSINGAEQVAMPLPFTTGNWGTSEPIVIDLKKGTNSLVLSRPLDMRKGIVIRDFQLKPAK
jgi:hypothetical protein